MADVGGSDETTHRGETTSSVARAHEQERSMIGVSSHVLAVGRRS